MQIVFLLISTTNSCLGFGDRSSEGNFQTEYTMTVSIFHCRLAQSELTILICSDQHKVVIYLHMNALIGIDQPMICIDQHNYDLH